MPGLMKYSGLSLLALLFLASSSAFAQDDLKARIEHMQARVEQAYPAGDLDTMMSAFSDDAVLMPFSGGMYEGADAIRAFYEKAPRPSAMDIRSVHIQVVGGLVIDTGTFTHTLPQEAGGTRFEGEYIGVLEDKDGELTFVRLVTFPARKAPAN